MEREEERAEGERGEHGGGRRGRERVLERSEGLMEDGRNAVNVESFEVPESGVLVDLQLITQTQYSLSHVSGCNTDKNNQNG